LNTPLGILQQYWKHSQFRPLQEQIIQSVLDHKDTLALLPTGGGKSVCFQVPGLLLEGVCIVITPLIALMKDQVEQLKKRGILAVAIHSGMSRAEIDIVLDNAIYGQTKFLYVSPERLQTEIFIERVKQMNVGLIAVDEAHCISQWGYDFRPPYLHISTLRDLKPDVPVIALTASATAQVQEDIMDKLAFRKPQAVYKKSFARDNLSFVVRKTENKEKKLIEILQKVKGTAIVYVRSRKATQELAVRLARRGITASFYHAGLAFEERTKRQEEWIDNKTRVIVATNAFGMGIDKPDVRTVVHLDIPENLESYYQEAGRAGRDGLRAFAVILYQDADVANIETKVEQSLPSIPYLKKIYQCLANYYQLAIGSSEGEAYDFDLHDFSERFSLNQVEVYNGLKKLEEEGLIQFNESFYSPSILHFTMDHTALYQFQVANARFDEPIKMLLRLYGGELYSGFVKISESYAARSLNITVDDLIKILKHLHDLKVVHYAPAKDQPQITFVLPRQDAENLPLNIERLNARKKLILHKLKSMVNYVVSTHQCRMQLIQDYFDEITTATCGICDVCISKRKKDNAGAYQLMRTEVLKALEANAMAVEELEQLLLPGNSELFMDVVRELIDEGVVEYDKVWRLKVASIKK
jgi:ATP-dependent DNA helicase RecQ